MTLDGRIRDLVAEVAGQVRVLRAAVEARQPAGDYAQARWSPVVVYGDVARDYPGTTTAIPADRTVLWISPTQPAAIADGDVWVGGS